MNYRAVILIYVTFLCCGIFCSTLFYNASSCANPFLNVTASSIKNRDKRFIVFENGGVCKFVVGVTFPLDFGDKKPWRSLNLGFNFQAQYSVPTNPIYWWDRWDGRTLESARKQYDKDGTYAPDESRRFLYALIELYANKAGKNGKQCLLRAICDSAKVDEVEGIYGEIIQAVLTPGDSDVDEEYKDAQKAGKYGAICTDLYRECPLGQGIFDGIAFEYTSNNFNLN